MVEICGVCQQVESKYKCPSCQLRYCSIACYKQHKETHANHAPRVQDTQPTQHAQSLVPESDAPKARGALAGSSRKIDFTGFDSDPELLRLLSRYPNLRIQLQSVYGLTLEPPPQEQRSFSSRGRGRGRGRGGFHQQSHWSQAKGDKEAADSFRNMRNAEADDQALAEFVQLLKMRFASVTDDAET
ncbi:hypothetical protein AUEXF2481DRAFT_7119 [Aureobasidium subglaciale EXF-2481]|uniref:HIT-type domain-containing protein n=1 Tax=Aureobasidium subglaciale (strain EXF-2481) TaxID=1043005 RepID=A0A074Z2A0_AURSE|nr:uncharacterized protein AUEXF2481DRAFT_7119 [Aureobasidium subglaciale EXF-2481]KAI5206893.1 hypothetical protein E4T38_03547 [Aureobasidium subglaciale]KAI5225616.1 hypothetical protein E4T40_03322 [Aureobasidium subglaciale]KAI5229104.1 hypothetical protein E4T41_03614 [Aureobasidium subglaciale]KAI5263884.1 hypothetical protein E4T46_03321 [Aureobasidium subglaciale]KEQ93171.1 hypothetical protein AUEXF2481DRAFT_7119 [Aureobasidium subglaciale EXF-2481]